MLTTNAASTGFLPVFLATSYPGFEWLIGGIVLFGLAVTIGAVAAVAKQTALATACGVIVILYGMGALALLSYGVDEYLWPLMIGVALIGLGAVFCWLPRRLKAAGRGAPRGPGPT